MQSNSIDFTTILRTVLAEPKHITYSQRLLPGKSRRRCTTRGTLEKTNKTPAVHQDILRLESGNRRSLPPPWLNAIFFRYIVKFGYCETFPNFSFLHRNTQLYPEKTSKIQIQRAGTNGNACFRTSASALVKRNTKFKME